MQKSAVYDFLNYTKITKDSIDDIKRIYEVSLMQYFRTGYRKILLFGEYHIDISNVRTTKTKKYPFHKNNITTAYDIILSLFDNNKNNAILFLEEKPNVAPYIQSFFLHGLGRLRSITNFMPNVCNVDHRQISESAYNKFFIFNDKSQFSKLVSIDNIKSMFYLDIEPYNKLLSELLNEKYTKYTNFLTKYFNNLDKSILLIDEEMRFLYCSCKLSCLFMDIITFYEMIKSDKEYNIFYGGSAHTQNLINMFKEIIDDFDEHQIIDSEYVSIIDLNGNKILNKIFDNTPKKLNKTKLNLTKNRLIQK